MEYFPPAVHVQQGVKQSVGIHYSYIMSVPDALIQHLLLILKFSWSHNADSIKNSLLVHFFLAGSTSKVINPARYRLHMLKY